MKSPLPGIAFLVLSPVLLLALTVVAHGAAANSTLLNQESICTNRPDGDFMLNQGQIAASSTFTTYLPLVTRDWAGWASWARSDSYPTTCAEEDNINAPIFARQVNRFQVTATHPTYNVDTYDCLPNFSGCGSSVKLKAPSVDPCFLDQNNKIFDDHISNAIWACPEPNWWRSPYRMTVTVPGNQRAVERMVWIRKISDADSWPQVLVLYEDGNLRLKPQSALGGGDPCFGSSVIIGPAIPSSRPFVDIEQVQVNPSALALDLTYRNGGTAHINLYVDRSQANALVDINYPRGTSMPFAIFRSMYVSDGNADVDHVKSRTGDTFIMAGWTPLEGPGWFFHRTIRSSHNTPAPDIRIEILN